MAFEELKIMNEEGGGSSAFANGVADGQSARTRQEALSPYQNVGMDDYANGFRAGFFGRRKPAR